MPMPEATVHKDRDTLFGKNKIRFPEQRSFSPPSRDLRLAKKWIDNTREKLGQPTDLQLLQKTFDRMK